MIAIALVGAGQLGSRHLQGLAKINYRVTIDILDLSEEALKQCRNRFAELQVNPCLLSVNYHTIMQHLPKYIDIAIISTEAGVRGVVINELLKNHDVQYLILEKVLFQKEEEYLQIENLLEIKKIKAWVNHPRRMYPFYRQLKNSFRKEDRLTYKVNGGQWGLACNGLHFIDHLAFLTDEAALKIDTSGLNTWAASKRRGKYLEVSGTLAGTLGANAFELTSSADENEPLTILISSRDRKILIDEARGFSSTTRLDGSLGSVDRVEKIIYYQSELTHIACQDIIRFGECDLPLYAEAMPFHLVFITKLLQHINYNNENNYLSLPIT